MMVEASICFFIISIISIILVAGFAPNSGIGFLIGFAFFLAGLICYCFEYNRNQEIREMVLRSDESYIRVEETI